MHQRIASSIVRPVALLACFTTLGQVAACSLFALDGLSGGGENSTNVPPDAQQQDASSNDGFVNSPAPVDGGAEAAAPLSAYAKAVLEDKPRAYYRFEEGAGTVAVDVTGSFNGTYAGAPALGATGILGTSAVRFPPASPSCVEVEHNGAFDFAGRAALMTIEMWIRPTSFNSYLWLIGTEPGSSPRIGWSLLLKETGVVAFEQYGGGPGDRLSRFATNEFDPMGLLAANVFTHVVLRMTDSGGNLFINTRSVYTTGNPTLESVPGQKKLYVGCRSNGVSSEFYFEDGIIDELAIYDHPLPDLRIKTHYDLGKPP